MEDSEDIWEILNSVCEPKKEVNIIDINKCSSCNSKKLLFDSTKGCQVCKDCGVVNENILDRNPEWTNYDGSKSEGSARCGGPIHPFLPKSSLGTTIVGVGAHKVKMMQKWDQMPYKERSLSEVLKQIESKCRKYHIVKSVIDNAHSMYKKISDIKHDDGTNKGKSVIIRGMNRKSIIAACVFYGAINQDFPLAPKDVADIFNLALTQVTKGIRHFETLLSTDTSVKNIESSDPSKFIKSYYAKLGLKREMIPIAIMITRNITELDIASNHQPISIAAGSILLMSEYCNISVSKKKIAEVFKISEVTINKIYNKIKLYGDIITDYEKTKIFKNKINKENSSYTLMPDEKIVMKLNKLIIS